MTVACTAPNNIRSLSTIPFSHFANDTFSLGGVREISADEVKSLFVGIRRSGLNRMSAVFWERLWGAMTCLYTIESIFEFLDGSGDNNNVCSFLRKLNSDRSSHPIGTSSNDGSLFVQENC